MISLRVNFHFYDSNLDIGRLIHESLGVELSTYSGWVIIIALINIEMSRALI